MRVSVIIPALNEEGKIGAVLDDLSRQAPDEIIVVDGGSADRTREIASRNATVVDSPRGRARQMNQGARSSTGDILLFLHADTVLPEGAVRAVRQAVASGKCEGGRFRLRFDESDFLLRIYSLYTRFHFFSYGDQAFFVKRSVFEKLRGFAEDVPFEDIDFYKRLRAVISPVIFKSQVVTSARRFRQVGKLRQKWINLVLVTLYYLGFNVLPLKEKVYADVR